jgi:hypothetical protein
MFVWSIFWHCCLWVSSTHTEIQLDPMALVLMGVQSSTHTEIQLTTGSQHAYWAPKSSNAIQWIKQPTSWAEISPNRGKSYSDYQLHYTIGEHNTGVYMSTAISPDLRKIEPNRKQA